MKVIILLAVLSGALAADPPGGPVDPCLQQCRDNIKNKLTASPGFGFLQPTELGTPEGRAKIRTFVKNYVAGTTSIASAVASPETWAKLCTIATEGETCLAACPDSQRKEGSKKFLTLFKLGCSEDFKSSLACIAESTKVVKEECQTKCQPLAAKLSEFIAQREANPTETTPAPKDVLESGCKFVNCRLNCRKPTIVEKCQEKGFEQSKKLLSALAISSRMLYRRTGGDLSNWPDVCKDDKIIEPAA